MPLQKLLIKITIFLKLAFHVSREFGCFERIRRRRKAWNVNKWLFTVGMPVWPDVRIKISPIFIQICPKRSNVSLYLKSYVFHSFYKLSNIRANFATKFVTKIIQKQPNLVTLLRCLLLWQRLGVSHMQFICGYMLSPFGLPRGTPFVLLPLSPFASNSFIHRYLPTIGKYLYLLFIIHSYLLHIKHKYLLISNGLMDLFDQIHT